MTFYEYNIFVHNAKISKAIVRLNSCWELQMDKVRWQQRSGKWLMHFNFSKYIVMQIDRSKCRSRDFDHFSIRKKLDKYESERLWIECDAWLMQYWSSTWYLPFYVKPKLGIMMHPSGKQKQGNFLNVTY